MKMMSKWAFMAVVSLSAIVSLCFTSNVTITVSDPSTANPTRLAQRRLTDTNAQSPSTDSSSLQYDFYQSSCPRAQEIVLDLIKIIVADNSNSTAQLLRLLFHDCFIEGCDASALLVSKNGTMSERDALPNKTLKGFQFIDVIKEAIEQECPGIVSCADILVLSVRDSIFLSGGPFYPIATGRRDSTRSFRVKADAEIPRPMNNVSEFLRLFSLRGFDEREVTALLGGHNIGHIGCQFVNPRFSDFNSSSPDPSMELSFFEELRQKCVDNVSSIPNRAVPPQSPQELVSDVQPFLSFDGRYYRNLIAGKGILFADQQLTIFEKTLKVVQEYASDDSKFRMDFARAMVKLSNLGVLTGSQGQIRRNCSITLNSMTNSLKTNSLKKKRSQSHRS